MIKEKSERKNVKPKQIDIFVEKFDILKSFRKELCEEGKSKNTVDSYLRHLKTFFNFCQFDSDEDIKDLDRDYVTEYKSMLQVGKKSLNIKPMRATTVNAHLSAISEFNQFLISEKILTNTIVSKKDFMKINRKYFAPDTMNREDVEEIRHAIMTRKDKRLKKVDKSKGNSFLFKKRRDYLMVTMMAFSGLRVSELLDLPLDEFIKFNRDGSCEINESKEKFVVGQGKGDKEREVVILPELREPLKSYIEIRGMSDECPYLFTSRQGGRMDRSTVNKLLKEFNVNPHKFRHFLASYLINVKKFTLVQVQGMLGHEDIGTLAIYAQPTAGEIIDKYANTRDI